MLKIAPDTITVDDGTDFLHLATTGLTSGHVDLKYSSQHPRPGVILVNLRVCRFILLSFTKLKSLFLFWFKYDLFSSVVFFGVNLEQRPQPSELNATLVAGSGLRVFL